MFETTFATNETLTVPIPDGFNADCKIINNSGVDVMVLDGTASSDTASEILFEQNLAILADKGGSRIIKNGATATYLLDDSYIDEDNNPAYSYCYNLMIVRADNLFPVKVMGVMPNYDTFAYDDIAITTADYKAMQESQQFQQNLMAYPDSLMATQFVNICNGSMNNSGSDKDIDSKVNAFFAATENYKNVTLNSLTTVQTYWEVFPFIWAGYAASKSYYLYSSNSSVVSYVGSLDITAPSAATASIDKSLPGFTLRFSPADNSAAKTLKYINGQFVDSVETTTIAIKGVYQLKSQFTNVATDNIIMAFMSGSVNGAKIIGYNEKLKKDSDNNWSGLYPLLHPKDAAGWMTLILEIGAVVMTLELFSRPLKYFADKYRQSKARKAGKDPSAPEVEKMRQDAKGKQARDAADFQRTMDRMGIDISIKIDFDVNGSISKLQIDRNNRITEDSRSNLTDITNRQVESLKTVAKYESGKTIQEMATEVASNKVALDPVKTPTEKFAGMLEKVKATAKGLVQSISDAVTNVAKQLTANELTEVGTARKANEDALKTQEEIEKSNDTKDKGDNKDIETDDIPKGEK